MLLSKCLLYIIFISLTASVHLLALKVCTYFFLIQIIGVHFAKMWV